MRVGDWALFYHSSAKPPGVAGLAKICKAAYPDDTAFDKKSKYHDPKSDLAAPRWFMVDLEFVERFKELVPLDALKAAPELDGILVIKKGQRLSVQPVDEVHFRAVLKMAGARRGPRARRARKKSA